jgi:uncharacterized protein
MQRQPYDWLVISIALVAAIWVPSSTWERVKTRPKERTIDVTGSAKRRIVSDLIQWTATVEAKDADRTAAYRKLKQDVDKTVAYLQEQGVEATRISVGSASLDEQFVQEEVVQGEERVYRNVSQGFLGRQDVVVRSNEVSKVERVSREVTQLLEQGISITSQSPSYFYTGLGELKIEMLAEASSDARVRADRMVEASGGGEVARLRKQDMGVINVNPPNVTGTSWDGNNDTSSYEKDIITIVHATFELED